VRFCFYQSFIVRIPPDKFHGFDEEELSASVSLPLTTAVNLTKRD